MNVEVSLWAWLLLALGPGVVGVVLIGYWDEVKTRRRVERERDRARRDATLAQRMLASERRLTELLRPPARLALDAASETPGGRDTPPREGVVLVPDGTFPLPTSGRDATAVLADYPAAEQERALERAQPLDPAALLAAATPVVPGTLAPALEVAAAHGQVRQRMDPPPWETAADAYDVFEGDDEPPRPDPLRQAAGRLAELEPAPAPEPEPDRRDDEDPPQAGGRALTPFGVDPAATTTLGGPVVRRHPLSPAPPRPAGTLPYAGPRDALADWMRRHGTQVAAYIREPIRVWYRSWPARELVSHLRAQRDEWVGSWPAGGRHRAVAP